MKELITRRDYLDNSQDLFIPYFGQFVTQSTKEFVKLHIGLDKLMEPHVDSHLNNVRGISLIGGSWIWDYSPINLELAYEAGEVQEGYQPSLHTRTCVGKAAALILIQEQTSL